MEKCGLGPSNEPRLAETLLNEGKDVSRETQQAYQYECLCYVYLASP